MKKPIKHIFFYTQVCISFLQKWIHSALNSTFPAQLNDKAELAKLNIRFEQHFLEPDQINYLVRRYERTVKVISRNFSDYSDLMRHSFKAELICSWAAWEIEDSEFYRDFLKQKLIPYDYIYRVRDIFILLDKQMINSEIYEVANE